MNKLAVAVAALLALPAAAPRPSTPVQTIIYETGPCFGRCPVYRLTINSNGSGTFEGRRFTASTGTHPFRFTPAQYRAFATALEPARPAHGSGRYSGERCRTMATDLPSAEVTWAEGRSVAIDRQRSPA
jgi:hypothetical protein